MTLLLVRSVIFALLLLRFSMSAAIIEQDRSRRQALEPSSVDGDIFAVARCRVACLMSSSQNSTTKFGSLADLMESEDPTASMCWETCQLLIENWWTWHYMCDQYRLCLPGCQKACQFVMALRDTAASERVFLNPTDLAALTRKKQCSDTSNIIGFSSIKWTCDAQDSFHGCQVTWAYPLLLNSSADDSCSVPPEQSLVYVIFYNEDEEYPASADNRLTSADGLFTYKQQTYRAAAMTFESSITLTSGDDESANNNNQAHDGPRIAPHDMPPFQGRAGIDILQQKQQRRGFFIQIVAVSSLGVVANSKAFAIRSGTYGIMPPFFPPARLTPTVLLKNIDFGLSALLTWKYPLPFWNNNTKMGFNEIQLFWRRHSCNVEPTFPKCELIPRTWTMTLDSKNIDVFLSNLTYNSAYELYVAMAGANSSRVLITTPGCFTPDATFRFCLPTTVTKDLAQHSDDSKNSLLMISLISTSVVVVVTAIVVGLFVYFRLYRHTKPAESQALDKANPQEPNIPPNILRSTTPGVGDEYADFPLNPLSSNYHPRSTGRDSAYDSYVGSVHQLSMMGMFRDQWEISESQLTIQKLVKSTDAVDWYRGVLGRETVCIKRLKVSSTEWRDHFLNELAILKMLERHANVLNIVACITANTSSAPVMILEQFANSMSLADYWKLIQRHFLQKDSKKKGSPRRQGDDKQTKADDAVAICENEPDLDALTLSLQSDAQLDFMRQIASGMAHIHSHQFTHGCLEPYTSILVSVEARLIKITGIGSSSNLAKFVNTANPEYHVERYLSPECGLANPIKTNQGDVWSFAVVCWQMASLGAQPYMEIPVDKLQQCVTSGFKLEQPNSASNKMYELFLRCWDSLPQRRPSFQEVLVDLHTLLNSNSRHVDHNKVLSSAIPAQLITPMLPEPASDEPRMSVADDDDSVFGGSTLGLNKPPIPPVSRPIVSNHPFQPKNVTIKLPPGAKVSVSDDAVLASITSEHV